MAQMLSDSECHPMLDGKFRWHFGS